MTPESHAMRLTIRSWKVLAALAGVWVLLTWLSYPRPNVWLAAHFSLAPLALVALRADTRKHLVAVVYGAAFIWWSIGLLWLYDVAALGYLALAAYLAVYPLAFALLLRSIDRATRLPAVFTVPIVWVACEYLRGSIMTWNGFPWFLLGHSQPTAMIQVADFAGAYGVSFVVAMTSGAIVDVLTRPLTAARVGWRKTAMMSLTAWLVAVVATLGYGMFRLSQQDAQPDLTDAAASVTVAIVQTDIPLSNKLNRTPQQSAADFAELKQLTDEVAAAEPQLVVWPETVVPGAINDEIVVLGDRITALLRDEVPAEEQANDPGLGYWPKFGRYRRAVAETVRRTNAWFVVGAHAHPDPTIHPDGSFTTSRTNAAYLFAPDGRLVDRFDKVHRVPFGEFVPFIESDGPLRSLMLALTPYGENYQSLAAGTSYSPLRAQLESRALRLGTPICFEDVVSYVCRRMCYAKGAKRVDLLVNLTNDGWYPGSAEGPQHEQIARFRCIENRVPMARSVNRGISSFIDSSGRVVDRVEVDGQTQMVAGVAVSKLALDGRSTFFGRYGDAPAMICLVLSAVLGGASIAVGRRKGT